MSNTKILPLANADILFSNTNIKNSNFEKDQNGSLTKETSIKNKILSNHENLVNIERINDDASSLISLGKTNNLISTKQIILPTFSTNPKIENTKPMDPNQTDNIQQGKPTHQNNQTDRILLQKEHINQRDEIQQGESTHQTDNIQQGEQMQQNKKRIMKRNAWLDKRIFKRFILKTSVAPPLDFHLDPDASLTSEQSFTVTYWMFYPYNKGKKVCSGNLWPIGRIPKLLVNGTCLWEEITIGNHIGDWEHMSLFFKVIC